MSVYTKVSLDEARSWVKQYYSLGKVLDLRGIASGIENTNYFLDTDQGTFVLTLFEKLTVDELPFYLNLMAHLSGHGVPVPKPIRQLDHHLLGQINGKPAAVVSRIPGEPITEPTDVHVNLVGEQLALLHQAGQSFPGCLENLRGRQWWSSASEYVFPFLDAEDKNLLETEIEAQREFGVHPIPKGPIHADLFRDNVLFSGGKVGGFIDLYFACNDALVYDVAITVNDWCTDESGGFNQNKLQAVIEGYSSVRMFTKTEASLWPLMLRAGALRFWVSRLYDMHLPRPGELTHAHNPDFFKRVLTKRREEPPVIGLPSS